MIGVDTRFNHNNIPKKTDSIDKAAKAGIKGIKVTKNLSEVFKCTVQVVELFEKIPHAIDETLVAMKSFKIISGMLSLPKLVKSSIKVTNPDAPAKRFVLGFKIVKYAKKIYGGVEVTLSYLVKLKVVTKAALKWTEVVNTILAPFTFISGGFIAYEFSKKVQSLKTFKSELAQAKAGATTPHEKSLKVCIHLLTRVKTLQKMKVISKNCPFKDRLHAIIARLEHHDPAIKQKAIQDEKHIRTSLKNRIIERVGKAAIKTTIKAIDLTSSIIHKRSTTFDTGLTITALVTTVILVTSKLTSKYIPTGDIMPDEKPMLFTRAYKTVRTANKALLNIVKRFVTRPCAAA